MRALLLGAVGLAALAGRPAHAQFSTFVQGPATSAPSCTGGYQGPGDIIGSGWKAWGGFRAYSCAKAGAQANAVQVCTAGDASCEVEKVGTNGSLVLGTLATACTTTCLVKTVYDQSGTGADLTQATAANQPKFTKAALGSLPGMTCTAGSSQWVQGTIPVVAQPLYMTDVVLANGIVSVGPRIMSTLTSGEPLIYWQSSTEITAYVSGTFVQAIDAIDTSFAVQATFNGSSSIARLNTSPNSGSVGAGSTSTSLAICADPGGANPATMTWGEGGLLSGTLTTGQQDSMETQERAFWGF